MRIITSLRYFRRDLFLRQKSNTFRVSSRLSYCTMGSKSALILLAEGAEEMEFVISADVLRRAGIYVTVAGLKSKDPVKCSREVVICPDIGLDDALAKGPYDVVILPGGLGGAKALAASSVVGRLLQEQDKEGRLIAAICAGPTALQTHGVCFGKSLTSYPSFREEFETAGNYKYKEDVVVTDGNLITSRGPATAFEFALTIVDKLLGAGTSTPIAKAMLKV